MAASKFYDPTVMDAAGENQPGRVRRIGTRFRICGAGGRPVEHGACVDGLCSAIGLHALLGLVIY